MTRDTWDGNTYQPISYNLWNYARSNPINYTDPTGMCWVTINGAQVWIPDNAYPCRRRNQLPTSALSIIEGGSQYISHMRPNGGQPIYHNLCGHFSVEIVIEALTGQYYSIHDLINAMDKYDCSTVDGKTVCGDTGTVADELAKLITPAIGSQATISAYINSDYHVFELDAAGKPRLFNRNIHTLDHYWYRDSKDNNIGLEVMADFLKQKNYLIVGMVLDTRTGSIADHPIDTTSPIRYVGHWVVIKSVDDDLVSIINPFRNRLESYSWNTVIKGSIEQAGWMVRIEPK